MLVNLIESVYRLLWGDLFTLPIAGGIGISFMVVLLSTVNLLKEYALVQGITQGGPGLSTTFIIQYIFDKGFNQMQYGYASAISTVVMIIFALIAFAQFKVNNGGET